MSVHDPIADALTIIRNGTRANKSSVELNYSNKMAGVLKILKEEGYIKNYKKIEPKARDKKKYFRLAVDLKYAGKENVISGITRVSKPGMRVYASVTDMPRVRNGLGIAIVSTSSGIITDKKARASRVGGEVLCYVW